VLNHSCYINDRKGDYNHAIADMDQAIRRIALVIGMSAYANVGTATSRRGRPGPPRCPGWKLVLVACFGIPPTLCPYGAILKRWRPGRGKLFRTTAQSYSITIEEKAACCQPRPEHQPIFDI
jgi:hypothetical protein